MLGLSASSLTKQWIAPPLLLVTFGGTYSPEGMLREGDDATPKVGADYRQDSEVGSLFVKNGHLWLLISTCV